MKISIANATSASLVLALAAFFSQAPAAGAATPPAAKNSAATVTAQPAGAAKSATKAAEAAAEPKMEVVTYKGKVVEAKDAGRSTYLQIDTGKAKHWAVLPKTKVTVGQQVELRGMVVTKYVSQAMKRTFDTIIFSDGIAGKETGMDLKSHAIPKGHPVFGK